MVFVEGVDLSFISLFPLTCVTHAYQRTAPIKCLAPLTMLSTPSVKDLFNRGNELEIVDGRLNIIAKSGLPIPEIWLKLYEDKLVYELVSQMAIDVLVYESYSTGRYGVKRHSGVNLQFNESIKC